MKARRSLLRSSVPLVWLSMAVLAGLGGVVAHNYHLKSNQRKLSEYLLNQIKLLEAIPSDHSPCSYAKVLNSRITWMDDGGRVICDSWQNPNFMDNHSNRPEFQMALQQGEGQFVRFSKTMQKDLLYVAGRFSKGMEPQGIIRFSVPLNSYTTETIDFLEKAVVNLFGLFILSLIISYLCLHHILKPILRFKNWVSDIFLNKAASGVIDSGIQEIDELMVSFKDLSEDDRLHHDSMIRDQRTNRTVLGTLSEGIIYITKDFIIHEMNSRAGEILGLDSQKWVGSNFMNLQLPYRLQIIIEQCLKEKGFMESRGFDVEEAVQLNQNQQMIHAEVRSVLTSKGKIQGAAVILEDRTKVDRLEQIRRDFVSNVSHQLNTPLTAIIGAAHTLREETDREMPLQFLQMIDSNANRMKIILDHLQHLAKLEESGASNKVEKTQVEVQAFLSGLKKEILERDPDNAKRLFFHSNQSFTLNINLELMHLAVLNLVENAFKYAPTGIIELSIEIGDCIHIDVSDEGDGISPHEMERIFERFYRSDRALRNQIPGTGLGLPLVKHILRVHDGRLSVFNRKPKGCTFRCSLPFLD